MQPSSTIFAFCEERELPLLEQVRHRLGDWVVSAADVGNQGVLWSQSLTVSGHVNPFILWVEPNDLNIDSFSSVRWGEGELERAANCQWLIGVQTLFAADDPIRSYHQQLKMAHLASNQGPAFFDQNSLVLRSHSEVDRLVSTSVPPRTTEVFSVHAVVDDKPNPDGTQSKFCWLHTHGLQRTHTPDLELFDIPENLGGVGGQLINSVAEVLFGHPKPAPGQVLSIGHRLQVSYYPVSEILKSHTPFLGGPEERDENSGHNGMRLVITDTQHDPHTKFQTPTKILERLSNEAGVLFVSRRETERMARLARERWPHFGMLFARHRSQCPDWRFLCKLGIRTKDDEREHLWFDVLEIKPGQVHAKLLNHPIGVDIEHLSEDWYSLDLLTDWIIITELGRFNPESGDYLWEAASKLENAESE